MFPDESQGGGGRELHFISMGTSLKDGKKPGFYKQSKAEGESEWKKSFANESVKGDVVKMEVDSYVFEGQTNWIVVFYLQDEFNRAKVECSLNTRTKAIINSLANVEDLPGKELYIKLYEKDGYCNSYMEVAGQRVDWKYSYKDGGVPAAEMYAIPGKPDGKSYAKQDEFFLNIVRNELIPQFEGFNDKPVTSEAQLPAAPVSAPMPAPSGDELPF